ncbi:MAG: DUF6230 family protein [Acidobacteriota bacterium]
MAGSLGFVAMTLVLTTLIMTGSIYAALPLTGVGGFVIEATSIKGSGFELIPTVHDTNLGNAYQEVRPFYPQTETHLQTVDSITGLKVWKNIDLTHISSVLFGPIKYMKIVIEANGDTKGTNILLDTTQIQASSASFTNLTMDENYSPNKPAIYHPSNDAWVDPASQQINANGSQITPATGAEIGMAADYVELTNAQINAHLMSADQLTLPNMALSIHYFDGNDQEIDLTQLYAFDQEGNEVPYIKPTWEN